MKDFPKKPSGKPGKQIESHDLMFGEPVQLSGGVPTSRKYSGVYKPGAADPEGMPVPPGMLNFR